MGVVDIVCIIVLHYQYSVHEKPCCVCAGNADEEYWYLSRTSKWSKGCGQELWLKQRYIKQANKQAGSGLGLDSSLWVFVKWWKIKLNLVMCNNSMLHVILYYVNTLDCQKIPHKLAYSTLWLPLLHTNWIPKCKTVTTLSHTHTHTHRLSSSSLLKWSWGDGWCGEIHGQDGRGPTADQKTNPSSASMGCLNSQKPGTLSYFLSMKRFRSLE